MSYVTYAPKGSMRTNCIHLHRKCHHLKFNEMQVIEFHKYDGVKVVKCTDFSKRNTNEKTNKSSARQHDSKASY